VIDPATIRSLKSSTEKSVQPPTQFKVKLFLKNCSECGGGLTANHKF